MPETKNINDISYILNKLGEDRYLYLMLMHHPLFKPADFDAANKNIACYAWAGRRGIPY